MSLEQWLSNGWLRRHEPTEREISELLSVAERDLGDCRSTGLSADWTMSIAYNAALQAASAALAAAGYRVRKGESHHYRTIQSLAHTIGADSTLIVHLDAFRKKRNEMGYERAGVVSHLEADEMVQLAEEIKRRVEEWLRQQHPDLI